MKKLALIVAMLPSLAWAQPADPAFMQKAITALQAQRNFALDQQASSEAKAQMALEEIARLQAQVAKLTSENNELLAKLPRAPEPPK